MHLLQWGKRQEGKFSKKSLWSRNRKKNQLKEEEKEFLKKKIKRRFKKKTNYRSHLNPCMQYLHAGYIWKLTKGL